MSTGESSQEIGPSSETIQQRTHWIRAKEIRQVAIKDYLRSIDKEVPDYEKDVREHTAKILDEDEFKEFKRQFRFGGQQSLNFFVITGISNEFDDLESKVIRQFPRSEEVEGMKNEPFIANARQFNDRLYLVLGRHVTTKWTDPETGEPQRELYPDECIAVINRDTDLVHVRTADVALSRKICKTVARAVGIDVTRDDVLYKPDFDQQFIEELGDEIQKYINMSLHINESSDRTAGSVRFTSQKSDDGKYMDLRDDKQVQNELTQGDGNISRGYVKLKEGGFSFDLNRPQSKIWFRSYEREERINKIEELINDVLGQSGGYPQQKLQEFGNVSKRDSS
ncbi:hypothetical protein ACFQMM_02550 [Saliphagus sp. GCM10025308]